MAYGISTTPTWSGTSTSVALPKGAVALPPQPASSSSASSSSAAAPAPDALPNDTSVSVRVPAPASVGGFLQSLPGAVAPGAWAHVAAVVTSSTANVPEATLPRACQAHYQVIDVPPVKGTGGYAMPSAAAADGSAPLDAAEGGEAAPAVPTRLQQGVKSVFAYSGTVVQLYVNGILVREERRNPSEEGEAASW